MNKKNTNSLGQLGEDIACEYLKRKGYMLVERNFRKPWGELDIIAYDRNGTLVFIEVKALRQYDHGDTEKLKPEDHLTGAKLTRIKRTAALYAGNNPKMISNKKGWRIDLVAIDIPEWVDQNNLTEFVKQRETSSLRHYENIAV